MATKLTIDCDRRLMTSMMVIIVTICDCGNDGDAGGDSIDGDVGDEC